MSTRQKLCEYVSGHKFDPVFESKEEFDRAGNPKGKSLYMSGICIQGGIRNANGRVYPVSEIERAVRSVNDSIKNNYTVFGELGHPDDLNINLERACVMVNSMWMEGPNGYGKLKVLSTPIGQIVKILIEDGGKLGVSSRGRGNVKDDTNEVSDFELITIDVVAQPSAPGAYPTPIYEHLLNTKGGYSSLRLAEEIKNDEKAQRYLKDSLINIIAGLK